MSKVAASGADVVIVDLEDLVTPDNKPRAREMAREWLGAHRQQVTERRMGRWVRINALDSRMWRDDLLAVLPGAPDGIMLPKSAGPESVQQLGAELGVLLPGTAQRRARQFDDTLENGFGAVTIGNIENILPMKHLNKAGNQITAKQ